MKAMRVLVVTPWFPSDHMPVSGLFNLRDARMLALDHSVTVLHLIHPRFLAASGEARSSIFDDRAVRVIRQPYAVTSPQLLVQARAAIRRESCRADLLHTMALPALLPAAFARTRLPWVHTEHFSALVTPQKLSPLALGLTAMKPLLRRPDETVAVSAALAQVVDRYRERPSAIIGNEVMAPAGRVPERRNLGAGMRLIGVGGILARKGPVQAVETMAELVARGLDARLTWVGDGAQRDEMLATAARLGVEGRLKLAGQIEPRALSRELLASDLFLLPVETETFGVALAEALSHGLPVVTSGTGGHEEFLRPEMSRIVSQREPKLLAKAVQALLADPLLWSRAEIARYAHALFSEDRRRLDYAAVYVRAARNSRGPRTARLTP